MIPNVKVYNCDFREMLNSTPKNTIVVTDPPYNIGFKYSGYNDKLPEDKYLQMIDSLIKRFDCVILAYPEILYKIAVYSRVVPNRVISWTYNSNTRRQHRDIAFFGGALPNFRQVLQPYKNQTDKRIKKLMSSGKKGTACYDWWNVQQVKNVSREKVNFPCQIPVQIMKNVVGVLPKESVIFDPFLGSGTTAIACMELNRKFIGTEVSLESFNIASNRIKDYLNARAPIVNDFYIYDNAMRFSEGEHHDKNRNQ